MPPKRILHVVSAMNRGGTETLLMNVYRHMDRTKIQFDFVSHREEPCDYDEEIESLGGKIYHIQSLGRSGVLAYIQSLKAILSKEHYIAVHSHTDFQSGFPALAAKQAGIKKIVCHAHTNRMQRDGRLANRILLPILRSLIKYCATDYCACSSEAAHFLFGASLKDKVHIMENGIDMEPFISSHLDDMTLRQELGIASNTKILGHVGNLSKVKNHVFILNLLNQLRDDGEKVVAVFAGDGPLRQELENMANRLGLSGQVYFLGVRKDIPSVIKGFDVFIFPSLFEGFGIVTVEAQCAGIPCIASHTIPRSTDLKLGLMTYLGLDAGFKVWKDEIKKAFEKKQPAREDIQVQVEKMGFNIRSNISKWLALYDVTG